jgi:hypothetical protein
LNLLDTCRSEIGTRRSVRLAIVPDLAHPALMGVLQPKLLLPADLAENFVEEELRLIFLHELTHLKRGDVAVNWFLAGVRAVHWFNPVFWLAASRITAHREMACDAGVLDRAGSDSRRLYGHTLLRVITRRRNSASSHLLLPAGLAGLLSFPRRNGLLKRRIAMLTISPRQTGLVAKVVACLLIGTVAAVGMTNAIIGADEKPAPGQNLPSVRELHGNFQLQLAHASGTAESSKGPQFIRVYPVEDLLQRMVDEKQADTTEIACLSVVRLLETICGAGNSNGDKKLKVFFEIEVFEGDKLVVRGTPEMHEEVASLVKHWREAGMQQISLRVRMISTPKNLVEQAGIRWSRIDMPRENPKQRISNPLDQSSAAQPPKPIAETVSFQNWSVLSEKLGARLSKKLVNLAQGEERTNVIFAPVVTLFNGQTAEIADTVSRPFVVALQASSEDADEERGIQPVVRTIEDGTRLRMSAVVREKGGPIHLNCLVKLSEIENVKTASFRLGEQQKTVTYQVPEVTETRFNVETEIPNGQSLLISPLQTDDEERSLYILIEPKVVTPET